MWVLLENAATTTSLCYRFKIQQPHEGNWCLKNRVLYQFIFVHYSFIAQLSKSPSIAVLVIFTMKSLEYLWILKHDVVLSTIKVASYICAN